MLVHMGEKGDAPSVQRALSMNGRGAYDTGYAIGVTLAMASSFQQDAGEAFKATGDPNRVEDYFRGVSEGLIRAMKAPSTDGSYFMIRG